MVGLLKVWLQSWQSVQTEAIAAAQLAGNAGTSVGSKAFAFLNSVASSSTMGVAMLSVTVTTVVSTASVVYDVVLDPDSKIQAQQTSFDSGVIKDENGNSISVGDLTFEYGTENDGASLQDLMNAIHNPDEEHTIYQPWEPDLQSMLDSGLWTEDELILTQEDPKPDTPDTATDRISNQNNTPITPPEEEKDNSDSDTTATTTEAQSLSSTTPPPPPAVIGGLQAPPSFMVQPPPPLPPARTDDIIIIEQPTAATTAEEGSIFFGIQVLASGPGDLTYQWYQNTTNSTTGGTPINNRTIWGHVLLVPHELKVGTHYFYVVISAPGVPSVTSNVAVITVIEPPPPVFHTLTIIDGVTGITVSEERQAGRNVNLNAGTKTDKVFYNWTVVSGNVTLSNLRNPTAGFAMPARDVVLRSNWTDNYEVIIDLHGGSSTLIKEWADEGDTIFLDAGTLDGYVFSIWRITDNANPNPLNNHMPALLGDNSRNETTSFIMPPNHITVSAEWVRQYNLTVAEAHGPDATQSGLRTFDAFIELDPGIHPAGLQLVRWTRDPLGTISPRTNTDNPRIAWSTRMPASDMTVTAIWGRNVTLVSSDSNGSSGAGVYAEGDTVNLNAGTRAGHTFSHWVVTDTPSGPPGTPPLHSVTVTNETSQTSASFIMPDFPVTAVAVWTRNSYAVTVISEGTTDSTGSNSQVNFGTTVEINAGTRAGYTFTSWSVEGGVALSDTSQRLTTFIMPDNAVTITANWIKTPYYVTVELGGTAGSQEFGPYFVGDTVTINAGTQAGHSFEGWTTGTPNVNITDPTSVETTFTMPASNVTITANWDVILYNVKIVGGRSFNGVMGPTGQNDYTLGALVSLFPGFEPGFEFSHWTIEPNQPLPNWQALPPGFPGMPTHSFTMPAYDVIVTAHWIQQQWVTVDDSYANSALTGQGMRTPGQQVNIDAGTRTGWRFTGWTVELGTISLANAINPTTSFTMPSHPVTVKANWEQVFTVIVNPNGATEFSEPAQYTVGATVAINVGTRIGHTFNGWTVEHGTINLADITNPQTTFTMPAEHVQVNATWTPIPYDVEIISEGNTATATPEGGGQFTIGKNIILNAGTRTGYAFARWEVVSGGVSIIPPTQPMAAFQMPANDVTIEAIWLKQYWLTVEDFGDNSQPTSGYRLPSPMSPIMLNAGTRTGYEFKNFEVISGDVTITPLFGSFAQFTMPAEDVTIRANWTPRVTVISMGATDASGSGPNEEGATVTINAGTRDGWTFTGWSITGIQVPPTPIQPSVIGMANANSPETTFTMPSFPINIAAGWIENTTQSGDTPAMQSANLFTVELTEPPTPPTNDSTEPPEPETGEPTDPPPSPPTDSTEPPEPETGEPTNSQEQGTTNPPDEPTDPPAEEPQD